MSSQPWQADRELGLDAVRSAIASQFPRVDPAGLRWLGSGWEFDVFTTAAGWAFRFPRRAEHVVKLKKDETVLPLVAPVLAPVLVPRIELRGEGGDHFPYPFAGHRVVPGIGADHRELPPHGALAHQIGAALGRLHSVAPEVAASAHVEVEPDDTEAWLAETRLEAPDLAGRWPLVDTGLDWLEAARSTAPYDGPPRLTHNDLCPDHILVAPDSGELSGIIDWTDTALGDPVLDFIVLWAWRGPRFVGRVLEAYPLPVDSRFASRLELAVRVRTLHWLRSALREGADVEKHLAWVANAFRDSL